MNENPQLIVNHFWTFGKYTNYKISEFEPCFLDYNFDVQFNTHDHLYLCIDNERFIYTVEIMFNRKMIRRIEFLGNYSLFVLE